MPKQQMEGNEEQRRKAAREARAEGKAPSEVGATRGASKQRKEASEGASHQERLEQTHEGKQQPPPGDQARPGNRDEDPKRTNDWG